VRRTPLPAEPPPPPPHSSSYRIYLDLFVLLCGAGAVFVYKTRPAPAPTAPVETTPQGLSMPGAGPRRSVATQDSIMIDGTLEDDDEKKPKDAHLGATDFSRKFGLGGGGKRHKPEIKRDAAPMTAPVAPPDSRADAGDVVKPLARPPISEDQVALLRSEHPVEPEHSWLDGDMRAIGAKIVGIFVLVYFILARGLFRALRMGGGDNSQPLTHD